MRPGELAQLVLTDEPDNVANVGHVTSNADHREFAFTHGEMTREEFARFNRQWMEAVLARLECSLVTDNRKPVAMIGLPPQDPVKSEVSGSVSFSG
jgi:hypothetical protein